MISMAQTVLGGVVDFLGQLGVYDVLLPFLLVFTLMFAFLEKTKVLGIEVIMDKAGKEHKYTRKNLNAIVAFTTGFFVIASSQLVRIISEVMANVIILVVTSLCFMLTVGVYHTGKGEMDIGLKWKKWLFPISAIIVVLILFNSLGWIDTIYQFILSSAQTTWFATIIFLIIFIGLMFWITSSKNPDKGEDSKDK